MNTITTGNGAEICFEDYGLRNSVVFSRNWPLMSDGWEARLLFLALHGYISVANSEDIVEPLAGPDVNGTAVAGAARCIGAAIARHLAAAGASVVVGYAPNRDGLECVVVEFTTKDGKAVTIRANVASKVKTERLLAEIQRARGGLDVLINGSEGYQFATVCQIADEHFHLQNDLTVSSLALATQEALKTQS